MWHYRVPIALIQTFKACKLYFYFVQNHPLWLSCSGSLFVPFVRGSGDNLTCDVSGGGSCYRVPGSLDRQRREEDGIFYKIKDGIFFPPLLSNKSGTAELSISFWWNVSVVFTQGNNHNIDQASSEVKIFTYRYRYRHLTKTIYTVPVPGKLILKSRIRLEL
jgi:hypothetical protein